MTFDVSIIASYWLVLLKGLGLTVAFTSGCALLGSMLGFGLSLLRMSPSRLVKTITMLYVEFFRGTPLLIQLFWVFFCFPVVFRLPIPPYLSVIISLTLYMTAITSETFRGALKSISSEQHDACIALMLDPTRENRSRHFPADLVARHSTAAIEHHQPVQRKRVELFGGRDLLRGCLPAHQTGRRYRNPISATFRLLSSRVHASLGPYHGLKKDELCTSR